MTYITTHAAKCMLAAWTSYRARLGKLRCDHAALIHTIDIAAQALDIALERDTARTLECETCQGKGYIVFTYGPTDAPEQRREPCPDCERTLDGDAPPQYVVADYPQESVTL